MDDMAFLFDYGKAKARDGWRTGKIKHGKIKERKEQPSCLYESGKGIYNPVSKSQPFPIHLPKTSENSSMSQRDPIITDTCCWLLMNLHNTARHRKDKRFMAWLSTNRWQPTDGFLSMGQAPARD